MIKTRTRQKTRPSLGKKMNESHCTHRKNSRSENVECLELSSEVNSIVCNAFGSRKKKKKKTIVTRTMMFRKKKKKKKKTLRMEIAQRHHFWIQMMKSLIWTKKEGMGSLMKTPVG